MEKLRGQLPVIASSAKDVTNNIGNAGRTAASQLAEMVTGFERLNSFGQASARQAISVVIGNVDEAPVLTLNSLLVDEVSVTLQLRATDVDTPTTALVYQVATTRGGWFARTDAPDTAVTRFTQAEIDQARIRFVTASIAKRPPASFARL